MSLHKAATAAMLAFLSNYGRAGLVRKGTALTDANPDLKDNFTDALTDIVLLGRSLGLDMNSAIRCMNDHIEPSAVADDAANIALSIPARQAVVEMTDVFGNGFVIMPNPRGGWTLASDKTGTPNSFGNLFDRGAVVEARLEHCKTAKDVLDLITEHARRYISGPKAGAFTSQFPPRLVTA